MSKSSKVKKNPQDVSKRYIFSLYGIDTDKVEQMYDISTSSVVDEIPENTTKIDELEILKITPEVVSFLDESKRMRKCTISMIDFRSAKKIDKNNRYKCFWDRNFIPSNIQPIGCPIKYIPSKAYKSYYSELSKEKYTISENITKNKAINIKNNSNLKLEDKNYYLTDGVFCSLNCCLAYIRSPENKINSFYKNSESLLLQLYNEIDSDNNKVEILAAPHWRNLEDFGGNLNIEKFRETFNRINYVEHGIFCVSIGHLFEDQIKF